MSRSQSGSHGFAATANEVAISVAEIEGEVKKHKQRLIFFGVVLGLFALCFVVKTCSATPTPIAPSIACTTAGGRWHAETYNDSKYKIDAYCSKE